jgi:hypothetical protein
MTTRSTSYFDSVLKRLGLQYHTMAGTVGAPKLVASGAITAFRYEEQSDTLLCFLKGIKLVSTLNAANVLLTSGYVQEIGVLCRVADDCCHDIFSC